MTRLRWDDRNYAVGVEKGVIYPKNSPGVVWNGLISVEEGEADSDATVGYYDGQAYYRQKSSGGFSAKVTSFSYVEEMTQPQTLGFSYQTNNELHLVYNAMFAESDKLYSSLKDQADPTILVWNLVTTPIQIPGRKATSHLVIDLSKIYPETLEELTELLYGTDTTDPTMPPIAVVLEIFENTAHMIITDNGDGSFTAAGNDFMVAMVDADSFRITSPSVVYLDDHTYRVSSW